MAELACSGDCLCDPFRVDSYVNDPKFQASVSGSFYIVDAVIVSAVLMVSLQHLLRQKEDLTTFKAMCGAARCLSQYPPSRSFTLFSYARLKPHQLMHCTTTAYNPPSPSNTSYRQLSSAIVACCCRYLSSGAFTSSPPLETPLT